jgi:hypothetical protein
MFSLFKKSSAPVHTDKVWKTRQSSLKGMMTEALQSITKNEKPVILCWFDDRKKSLVEFLEKYNVPFLSVEESSQLSEEKTVFLMNALAPFNTPLKAKSIRLIADGHYPLVDVENKAIEKITPAESRTSVLFCQSLDDELFISFGGEKLVSLLDNLGLKEEESLEHAMITKSIERAREKLSATVTFEVRTQNEHDWFSKNKTKS